MHWRFSNRALRPSTSNLPVAEIPDLQVVTIAAVPHIASQEGESFAEGMDLAIAGYEADPIHALYPSSRVRQPATGAR